MNSHSCLLIIFRAEHEFKELMEKKRIIENDKAKIEAVIAELEEKKNEALKTTWQKVNKDFGSIFSTLLPGTSGKALNGTTTTTFGSVL